MTTIVRPVRFLKIAAEPVAKAVGSSSKRTGLPFFATIAAPLPTTAREEVASGAEQTNQGTSSGDANVGLIRPVNDRFP